MGEDGAELECVVGVGRVDDTRPTLQAALLRQTNDLGYLAEVVSIDDTFHKSNREQISFLFIVCTSASYVRYYDHSDPTMTGRRSTCFL